MDTNTLAPKWLQLPSPRLGQTAIRECVPFLISRDNVI
jgi:hypothetical protein